jgi:hypothetical protein
MSQWKAEEIRRKATSEPEIRDEDIPQIIARAQDLQDQAEKRAAEQTTAEDVTEIARELGIETRWVEQALEENRKPPQPSAQQSAEQPVVEAPPSPVNSKASAILRRADTWLGLSIVSFLWLGLLAAAPILLAHRARRAAQSGDVELAQSRLQVARVVFFSLTAMIGLSFLFALLVVVLLAA